MKRDGPNQSFAVLFVDDEEKAQKYFRMAYSNNFPVMTAGSVPEALEIMDSHGDEIGVLITDQRMPGQQGVDLLKRAREKWPEVVRILTTAYSDLDDAIAAVNRGEILRYVTKPWDIEGLRVELRHAMDFFLLRRERDLLMAEKLSVRRRMVHSDRLCCLLAVAAGLEHIRHAPHAVAAWVRDALAGTASRQHDTPDLELWGLEVKETLGLMNVHRILRELDESVQAGYPDRVALDRLLRETGLDVHGQAPEISVRLALLEPLIDTLVHLAGLPANAALEPAPGGALGLNLRVIGPGVEAVPFVEGLQEVGADARLLGAYLIAWHHGGTLRAITQETGTHFELTLPVDPAAVSLPEPEESWVAAQFSMLEDWD